MTPFEILFSIKTQIEQDRPKYTNYYWSLSYNLTNDHVIIIDPLKYYTYDKVIFMGDWLSRHCEWNPYLLELYRKYPIKIDFTVCNGVKIYIDESKLRKNKIKKLLDL